MLQDKLQQTGGWRLEVHHVRGSFYERNMEKLDYAPQRCGPREMDGPQRLAVSLRDSWPQRAGRRRAGRGPSDQIKERISP